MRGSASMSSRMGLIYRTLEAGSVNSDVLTALALISGGVANCRDAIEDQQKKNCEVADSSAGAGVYIAALSRCLRDENKLGVLIRTLESASFAPRTVSS